MSRTIVIGDIHGCAAELQLLLDKVSPTNEDVVISLGDVTDKGPHSREALRILMDYDGAMVLGNHDDRYVRYHKKGLTAWDVNNKDIDEKYKREYAQLAGTPEMTWMALYATVYTEAKVGGMLFTFTHAGAVPYIDLYDMKPYHLGEAIRVRYLDADTHQFIRMVKIDKDKYPDEVASWRPEHDNVTEWQKAYNYQYGTVVHGHIIVGPNPILWIETIDGDTKKLEVDKYGKESAFTIENLQGAGIKAISLDTGAHKGWNLTAMIIDDVTEEIYFEQVEVPVCYEP